MKGKLVSEWTCLSGVEDQNIDEYSASRSFILLMRYFFPSLIFVMPVG